MVQGRERAGVVAGDALPLGVGSDHVSGVVDERDQRQLVGVAQLDETGRLVGRSGVDGPGDRRQRLIGEDADGASAEGGERGDASRRPRQRRVSSMLSIVDQGVDDRRTS